MPGRPLTTIKTARDAFCADCKKPFTAYRYNGKGGSPYCPFCANERCKRSQRIVRLDVERTCWTCEKVYHPTNRELQRERLTRFARKHSACSLACSKIARLDKKNRVDRSLRCASPVCRKNRDANSGFCDSHEKRRQRGASTDTPIRAIRPKGARQSYRGAIAIGVCGLCRIRLLAPGSTFACDRCLARQRARRPIVPRHVSVGPGRPPLLPVEDARWWFLANRVSVVGGSPSDLSCWASQPRAHWRHRQKPLAPQAAAG